MPMKYDREAAAAYILLRFDPIFCLLRAGDRGVLP